MKGTVNLQGLGVTDVADFRRELTFVVFGLPTPKGSKRGIPIRRGDGHTGVAMVESSGEKLKDWIRRLESVVQGQVAQMPTMLEGPLAVTLDFAMPRPKSVRKDIVWHTKKPDIDKLARAVLDVCSGVLFADDALVCELNARKVYVVGELAPSVNVTIRELA
jgi:Holliday junction resolvase RusA-like endonuclease